jgi:hypothetical protein
VVGDTDLFFSTRSKNNVDKYMNGNVAFAYVNRKYFDDKGKTPRLNVDCSNSVGKDQYKKYINYAVTLWGDDAVYWNKQLTGDKADKQCVSFNGYISDVTAKEYKEKLYTTVQINVGKAGSNAAFFLLPPYNGGSNNNGNVLDDNDF